MENIMKDKRVQKLMAPAALVLLYLFFGFFGRNFFSYETLVNVFDASYFIGFIAIGVTFVIITGGIDLSVGTVMMCASIIGGTAYRTWGWPMELALLLILVIGTAFGVFNGLMVSRLKLPPFIATLGTMMISMGSGSIVSNVRSATFPTRAADDGWFKNIFKIITEDYQSIPTGAFVLFLTAVIASIILTKTKMGRYIFAIGSNKEAARLSGIDIKKWEMMAYITSGFCAGIGGIAFPAVYTTVMPAQGQGFELYAIAAAVIGGTSLSGGIGSIFGTIIGVFIISVLRSGLPAMDLQAHYQTFFTGVVVIGAVLLDIYRNRKASEVSVLSEADLFRISMNQRIQTLRQQLSAADASKRAELVKAIAELKQTRNQQFKKMKTEEKREQQQIRKEEKLADEELKQKLQEQG